MEYEYFNAGITASPLEELIALQQSGEPIYLITGRWFSKPSLYFP